jgi:hypothetical protein
MKRLASDGVDIGGVVAWARWGRRPLGYFEHKNAKLNRKSPTPAVGVKSDAPKRPRTASIATCATFFRAGTFEYSNRIQVFIKQTNAAALGANFL